MRLPILQLSCRFFFGGGGAKHRITQVCPSPLQPRFGSLRLLTFPKAKISVEKEEICECGSHTVHKLSQQRLTADWLAPRESGCSRMDSKVSSDWLPSYIKATRPVLEIFKMAAYFPDSPRTLRKANALLLEVFKFPCFHFFKSFFLMRWMLFSFPFCLFLSLLSGQCSLIPYNLWQEYYSSEWCQFSSTVTGRP